MATERPKKSFETPTEARSEERREGEERRCPSSPDHYEKEVLPEAPTTAVDPEMPTETPKWSPEAPSEAVSSACRNQVVPERTNTKAAPANEFLPKAPTTAVEPEMATERPKKSFERPKEA